MFSNILGFKSQVLKYGFKLICLATILQSEALLVKFNILNLKKNQINISSFPSWQTTTQGFLYMYSVPF